jgi:hypothetical protein
MCRFYSLTLPVTVVLIITFALAWLRKPNLALYTEPSHLAVFQLQVRRAQRF